MKKLTLHESNLPQLVNQWVSLESDSTRIFKAENFTVEGNRVIIEGLEITSYQPTLSNSTVCLIYTAKQYYLYNEDAVYLYNNEEAKKHLNDVKSKINDIIDYQYNLISQFT